MATMREASKKEWTSRDNGEDLQLGCLQRIADASEKMAGNFIDLQNDRDLYKRWFNQERDLTTRLYRRISALQGVITKMKKAGKE